MVSLVAGCLVLWLSAVHANLHRIPSHYLSLEQLLERLASLCGASDRCAVLSGGLAHGRQALTSDTGVRRNEQFVVAGSGDMTS